MHFNRKFNLCILCICASHKNKIFGKYVYKYYNLYNFNKVKNYVKI